MFKKLLNIISPVTVPVPAPTNISGATPVYDSTTGTFNVSASTMNAMNSMNAAPSYVYSGAGTTGPVTVTPSSAWSLNSVGTVFSILPPSPSSIITLTKPPNNQEVVRLNVDSTVTWANGIDVDAAAEAFGKSMQMGAELRAGISKAVKTKMRDSVFEDLINIAKEKGSLTAEDLTYLLEASKIVEKLKGGD